LTYTPYPTIDITTSEHFTGEYVEGKAIHRKLVKQIRRARFRCW
jgi:hypothetical protein